ncbi:Uncharacterised protein [Vibrio cholerae]|nr:Uncharacterised protein [Vibrio cholerae]CSI62133.1 Uncharacterised protein [Vibrio cholerae]
MIAALPTLAGYPVWSSESPTLQRNKYRCLTSLQYDHDD